MGPVPQERERPPHNSDSDIENADHGDVIHNFDMSDSDSGDDDAGIGYMGYQALGQDPNADPSNNDDGQQIYIDTMPEEPNDQEETVDDETNTIPDSGFTVPTNIYPDFPNTPNLPGYMQAPDLPRAEKKELLWNQTRTEDLKLDTGQVDQIKSVMSGIQLPATSIPDWARNLSDDQWQVLVVNKLPAGQQPDASERNYSSTQETKQHSEVTQSTIPAVISTDNTEMTSEQIHVNSGAGEQPVS